MEPVKRLANEHADRAAKQFSQQRQQLDEQQQRLAQLESFRQEYRGRLQANARGGIDPFRLQDYNAFIARIDAAVVQQKEAVVRSEYDVERSRSQWLEVLSRSRAIDKFVDRARADEVKQVEQREQRRQDERPWRPRPLSD
ncbi:flagellar export protein FliJ [Alkalilimnicola ehrlichii]|nr:flagellar export protein FliJ [Alkalilimnicola ehrlichii]